MYEGNSDRELIDRIQKGAPAEQAAAERALYRKYQALIHNYVVNHAPAPDVADVEQDAWQAVITSARKVELRLDSAKGWVTGIVRRVVASYHRRRTLTQQPLDEGIASEVRPVDIVEKRETLLEVLKAWRALTPEQRLVIFLADIAGVPLSEVIRWVGHSKQSIYEMHRRAREAVRSSTQLLQRGGEPQSEWLEPFGHTNMVIDLHPVLSDEERKFLADTTGVEANQLFDSFEFGMTLFVESTDEYLEQMGHRPGLFHLALLSREGLEEYLAGIGEGCDLYLFKMTPDGKRLTIDPKAQPLKTRTGWRLWPEDECFE